MTRPPNTRLYVLLARKSPVGVIFRRGPSKQVMLIKWNLENDSFEHGQWLKGRIYERRCDLSPWGHRLIYFAANYKQPYYSWTAVSKPPYLTALALWPKGDAWGGGGLFESESKVLLDHRSDEMDLAEGFRLAPRMTVRPLGEYSGRGEDDPIHHMKLLKEGWSQIQEGEFKRTTSRSKLGWEIDPPQIYSKTCSLDDRRPLELRMLVKGLHERDAGWYVVEYQIFDQRSRNKWDLGRLDWADWDKNGDLLGAKEGRVYRLKPRFRDDEVPFRPKNTLVLADFRDLRFTPQRAPDEAQAW